MILVHTKEGTTTIQATGDLTEVMADLSIIICVIIDKVSEREKIPKKTITNALISSLTADL